MWHRLASIEIPARPIKAPWVFDQRPLHNLDDLQKLADIVLYAFDVGADGHHVCLQRVSNPIHNDFPRP